MRSVFTAAAAFLAACAAHAEARLLDREAPLAVGRLNLAGQGHCSATLIAPDFVLTAAHCLENRLTGVVRRAERLVFLPGYALGEAAAISRGAAHARPNDRAPDRVATDIAVLRLAEPVDEAPPLPLAEIEAIDLPIDVEIISYGRDRPEAPSRQTGCSVTRLAGPLLLTDCEATPGVSGAPVMVRRGDELAVVGVVVAASGARPPALRGRAVAVAVLPIASDLVQSLGAAAR